MSRLDVRWLEKRLSPRDLQVLRTLRAHRLATTDQLRRWHFLEGFTSDVTSLRICQRALTRLKKHGLIARLSQPIGGSKRGAESIVWQLGATGDRLLSVVDGDHRRRYVEPGRAFISHGVAVTELAVRLQEAVRSGQLEEVALSAEPDNWQRFLGAHGRAEILKPDLTAITVAGEFENHLFLERDLGTEHGPAISRKAQVYDRFYATGTYQAEHGIFPTVMWVVDDNARREVIERALSRAGGTRHGIHRVVLTDDFLAAITAAHASEGDPTSH